MIDLEKGTVRVAIDFFLRLTIVFLTISTTCTPNDTTNTTTGTGRAWHLAWTRRVCCSTFFLSLSHVSSSSSSESLLRVVVVVVLLLLRTLVVLVVLLVYRHVVRGSFLLLLLVSSSSFLVCRQHVCTKKVTKISFQWNNNNSTCPVGRWVIYTLFIQRCWIGVGYRVVVQNTGYKKAHALITATQRPVPVMMVMTGCTIGSDQEEEEDGKEIEKDVKR